MKELPSLFASDRNRFWHTVLKLFDDDPEGNLSSSYVHENGFAKITFCSSNGGRLQARLHLWQDNYAISNIHTHCFDLHSTILHGCLVDRLYCESKDGVETPKFLYTRRKDRQNYPLESIGNARLMLTEAIVRRAGDQYAHRYDTIHSSEPVTREVITLFFADHSGAPETAYVYSNRYGSSGENIASPSMQYDDAINVLRVAQELTG